MTRPMPLRRRLAVPGLAIAALAGLAACSADAGDFQEDAEEYIDDSDDVSEQLGVDFSDAECEKPAGTDVDDTFTCVANGDDGNQWQFTAQITGDDEYLIVDAEPITAPADSTPGSEPTAPTTTAATTTTTASTTTTAAPVTSAAATTTVPAGG